MQSNASGTGPNEGIRVLLVEDSYTNQRIATRMLERLGFTVELAENGVEALDAFRRCSYDVVLMDIMMPEMDGHECTREIRRQFPDPHVPIIAVTANAMTGDRERCLEAGADDYLTKPFKGEELVATLDRWLRPGRLSRTTDAVAAAGDVLDLTRLEEIGLLGPEAESSLSLVELFREEIRAGVAHIHHALAAQDGEQLCQAAHRLKGGAASLGATVLATRAAELERCGRDGDLTQAIVFADALPADCDRVIAALEQIEQHR